MKHCKHCEGEFALDSGHWNNQLRCKIAKRKRNADFRERNKERVKVYRKTYYDANKENQRARSRDYHQANREERTKYMRERYRALKEIPKLEQES